MWMMQGKGYRHWIFGRARARWSPHYPGLALCAFLTLIALGLGSTALGLGHDHGDEDGLEPHSCVACHLQASSALPTATPDTAQPTSVVGQVCGTEPPSPLRVAPTLGPPHRGPPTA